MIRLLIAAFALTFLSLNFSGNISAAGLLDRVMDNATEKIINTVTPEADEDTRRIQREAMKSIIDPRKDANHIEHMSEEINRQYGGQDNNGPYKEDTSPRSSIKSQNVKERTTEINYEDAYREENQKALDEHTRQAAQQMADRKNNPGKREYNNNVFGDVIANIDEVKGKKTVKTIPINIPENTVKAFQLKNRQLLVNLANGKKGMFQDSVDFSIVYNNVARGRVTSNTKDNYKYTTIFDIDKNCSMYSTIKIEKGKIYNYTVMRAKDGSY